MEMERATRSRVLRDSEPRKRDRDAVDATSASLFVASGAAFVAVGLVDLALLWTPLRFGTPAWEFATLSQTFNSLPFAGLGLVLTAVGIVRHPRTRSIWVRVTALVFAAVAGVLVVLGFLYVTVAPGIVRQTPSDGLDVVGTTIVKNGAEILLYPIAFAAMSFLLWRGAKKSG